MAISQRGTKFRLDCTIKGERYSRTFSTRTEALAWQEKAKARVALGLPADEAVAAAADMTVAEAFKSASRSWMQQRDGSNSIANGKAVVEILGPSRRVSTLTIKDQDDLVDRYLAAGLAAGTINRRLSALSKMLNVARDAGVHVSLQVKTLREGEGRQRYFTFLEEQTVLGHFMRTCNHDLADFVQVALDTGCRLSELLAIDPSWVRLEAAGGWSLTLPWHVTKTQKPRTIPLSQRAAAILQERTFGGRRPWPEGWTQDSVDAAWAAMRKAIGMDHDKEFVFHVCRHTCAVRLLEATGNLVLVRDWLGHADIRTTQRYAKLVAGGLRMGATALDHMQSIRQQAM